MVLKIPAVDLKRIVKKLGTVTSKNTLIDTTAGVLSVLDLDMGVSVGVPAFKTGDTPFAIDSRMLNSTVSKLSKDVTLETRGESLVITSARFQAKLPFTQAAGLNAPARPDVPGFSLPTKELVYLISFVSSVCESESKLDHTGSVHITRDTQKLEAAATDNFRVALADCTMSKGIGKGTMLLPAKVAKILKEIDTDTIQIFESDSAIFFEAGPVTLFTKKLNKKFPNVKGVMPSSFKLETKIDSDILLDSLQKVAPTLDQESTPRVELDFNGDTLTLRTGTGAARAEDSLDVTTVIPDPLDEPFPLKMAANHKFLCQYLTHTTKSGIVFKANEPGKPFLLESGNKKILIAGLKI